MAVMRWGVFQINSCGLKYSAPHINLLPAHNMFTIHSNNVLKNLWWCVARSIQKTNHLLYFLTLQSRCHFGLDVTRTCADLFALLTGQQFLVKHFCSSHKRLVHAMPVCTLLFTGQYHTRVSLTLRPVLICCTSTLEF
jgi:hypothetical protein